MGRQTIAISSCGGGYHMGRPDGKQQHTSTPHRVLALVPLAEHWALKLLNALGCVFWELTKKSGAFWMTSTAYHKKAKASEQEATESNSKLQELLAREFEQLKWPDLASVSSST